MHVPTHSVDQRTSQHASSKSRAQEFMRRRRRNSIIIAIVAVVVVVFLVFNIASCAFRSFASASMALNDESVQNELVAAKADEPYYILLAGLSNYDESSEAASFIAILRVDEQNKQFSLMNIPSNIKTNFDQGEQDLIRNAVRYGGEGELVHVVKEQTGIDFSHYLRITEEGLQKLVDDIGGVEVNVEYRVDDPRVGHVVIAPGQQNLNGQQAIAFVSATNYTNGRTQRTNNQMDLFFGLINKMTSSEGIGWISDSDVVSSAIKTDMSYDALSRLATIYGEGATFYTASMPGSQYASNNVICFAPNTSTWNQIKERFMNGEDPNTSVDTSGVDKSKLSIVVQNGSGTDGFAAQAAQILEQHGYVIQDTGNADSFVYTETLVIYKDQDDEAAAEAIVADLGIGRAVYASVYYNLKTDIQVVVGQDWKPVD
jgi:LCP family protein required for cell wall assembly